MSRGVNKAFLLGRVGKDPEIRYSKSGNAVGNFSIATQSRRKRGDSWEDETEWHNIVVFGKTAETCAKYVRKGTQLFLEGSIHERSWVGNDGKKRYKTEIHVSDMQFTGTRKDAEDPTQGEGGSNYDDKDGVPF